jgi:hypothetical protein
MTGENPWNGTKEIAGVSANDPRLPTFNCTTREKSLIQPSHFRICSCDDPGAANE